MLSLEHRIGIVGTGRIAWQFDERTDAHPASIAGAFSMIPNAKLVAASSRGRERLQAFGKRYGVTALYQDFHEMLGREQLDIVVVATHPPLHPEIVTAAAQAGVRGIFCEKPMALSLGECDAIVGACEKTGTKLLVNCTRRWDGVFEAARRLVQEKTYGELLHISAACTGCKPLPEWEAQTEGPMLHDGVHLFDLMRFFAGDVESVIGTAKKRKRKELPVEDTTEAIFQFRNGVDGVVVVDELTEYERAEIELQFERAVLRLGPSKGLWTSKMSAFEQPWWYDLSEGKMPEPVWPEPALLMAARDMIDCVETKERKPRCDGNDGRAAIEIIMGIYESELGENTRVNFPVQLKDRMVSVLQRQGRL